MVENKKRRIRKYHHIMKKVYEKSSTDVNLQDIYPLTTEKVLCLWRQGSVLKERKYYGTTEKKCECSFMYKVNVRRHPTM